MEKDGKRKKRAMKLKKGKEKKKKNEGIKNPKREHKKYVPWR